MLFSTKTKQITLSFGLGGIKQMKTKHLLSFSTKPKQIAFSFRSAKQKRRRRKMEFYHLVLKQNKTNEKNPGLNEHLTYTYLL